MQGQDKARLIMHWGKKALDASSSESSLRDVISVVIKACESLIEHSICSVFLIDQAKSHINDIIAPGLPQKFINAIMGESTGPMAGTCGTAIYKKERIISQDIAHDPLWVVHRDVALVNDIRSSWSTPIFHEGNVWGVLNIYGKRLGRAEQCEEEVVDYFVGLLSNAISLRSVQKEAELFSNPSSDELSVHGIDTVKKTLMEDIAVRSEEGYQHILKTMMDGFVLFDQGGKIITTNNAYEKMIGYNHEELLGMNIFNIQQVFALTEIEEKIAKIMEKGSLQFLSQHRHKSGVLIDVDVRGTIMNMEGKLFVAGIIRDVTEKKRNDELMTRQFRALEKYAFINSHEVRARVATILGLINLHKSCYIAEEERSQLYDHLYRETLSLDEVVRKLTRLINDSDQIIE